MTNEFQIAASMRVEQLGRVKKIFDSVAGVKRSKCSKDSSSLTLPDDETIRVRRINANERETLETKCKCSCVDWSNFFLIVSKSSFQNNDDFSPELALLVSETRFDGDIVLDFASTEEATSGDTCCENWLKIPPGIHSNLLVADSIFNVKSCRVYRNSLITKTFVASTTAVLNCGHISGPADHEEEFNCGQLEVTVGAESGGGRNLLVTPEATMVDVTRQLVKPSSTSDLIKFNLSAELMLPFNVISHGSLVRDTPTVHNIYLYPCSSIEAASSVKNVIIYPQARISNASIVSNVLMQWNASISDNSKVNNVMMMEYSHCGPSSIVESTIMGPDTHASAGEIHASIFGPSTNAHHQSLLIGVLWPLGRGNVGYGANVGSNHTGRLPDQEATVGEGIFWGLGCVVKYPVDLTWTPYSIVAAGTKLPPSQRIFMPFSLIVDSNKGGNEIIPGWVLQSSPYTLARNDKKYSKRRKAERHSSYTGWKMFRPAIIEMCRWARNELQSSLDNQISPQDVSGIGTNVLTERGRSVGIKAYRDCIHRYVLQGLFTWAIAKTNGDKDGSLGIALERELVSNNIDEQKMAPETCPDFSSVEWPAFPWDPTEASLGEWEYQRRILFEEFPIQEAAQSTSWLRDLLSLYVSLENDFASRVAKCKTRDDLRGAETIFGYAESHVPSEFDPIVIEMHEMAAKIETLVMSLLANLEH